MVFNKYIYEKCQRCPKCVQKPFLSLVKLRNNQKTKTATEIIFNMSVENPLTKAASMIPEDSLNNVSVNMDMYLFLSVFLFILFILLSLLAIRFVIRIFNKDYSLSDRRKCNSRNRKNKISTEKDHQIIDFGATPIAPPRANAYVCNPIPVKPLVCNFNV